MNLEMVLELAKTIRKLDKSERLVLIKLIKDAPVKAKVGRPKKSEVKKTSRKSKRGMFVCPTCNEAFATKRGIGLHKAKAHD